MQNIIEYKIGDKVRIKNGLYHGYKGLITKIFSKQVIVNLGQIQENICFTSNDLVNFSLAARKAWRSFPKKNVGRKKKKRDELSTKISVTLRFELLTWQKFRKLEKDGKIKNRTEIFNKMLSSIINNICNE